ncbi:glutamate receptor U1-like [Lycorma delicatula]|uniref:glutamate receptor U1-like n=1 Tax=Lycorma delicatula TaxID=130591 RepID=UPI003F515557
MKLIAIKEKTWNASALISACKTCAEVIYPPVIYVQPLPFPQPPYNILPSLGLIVVESKLPLKGPSLIVLMNADNEELQNYSWNPENCYVRETAKFETFNDLNGSDIKVVLFPRPPILIQIKEKQFTGLDGEMLHVFEKRMNFTSVILTPSDGKRYGYKEDNGTFVGIFKDLLNDNADLAINGHFVKDYGTDNLTFSHYVINDQLCPLVPKAEQIPHLFLIVRCFSAEVWILIFISYMIIEITKYLTDYLLQIESRGKIFKAIQNMFNSSVPRCPRFNSDSFRQISSMFFTFIIANTFQGQIVTFLNTPIYYPELDTLEDIINSDLEIWSSKSDLETMLAEDNKLSKLVSANRIRKTTDHEVQCAARTKNIVRFSRNSHIDKVSLAVKEDLHVVSECLSSYIIAYILPRGSPLLQRVNYLVSLAVQSGLVHQWSKEQVNNLLKLNGRDNQTKVLSIHDLRLAFIIVGIGLLISTCVFIIEIVVARKQNKSVSNSSKMNDKRIDQSKFLFD